ncbi:MULTISPECIES: hypothetical protein [unclassified Mesorhizobium]|uniref:hypothetical protein n=1 Tax=unclassified Mesorhizobium TaxID=325217 RepID=UPI001CCDE33F|nr:MULTISPECIES: hypothetical protein [unclassified Mesorhizobium]MBZ9740032.1 hypothetical protein [Mesorhizobium sp. CO1-1-4]MBZ9803301.1 hypothetical protein [Mesorhizobium sp. ES1-6]
MAIELKPPGNTPEIASTAQIESDGQVRMPSRADATLARYRLTRQSALTFQSSGRLLPITKVTYRYFSWLKSFNDEIIRDTVCIDTDLIFGNGFRAV